MNIHQNARLTPSGRERLVRLAQSGLSPKAVAETMGVCPKTVGKWVARFEAEGTAGLQDRSSRPPHPAPLDPRSQRRKPSWPCADSA